VNCGTKLEDAWSHCAKCGRARGLAEGKIPDINPYKSPSDKPKFKLGCLSLIFIVIAVGSITSAFSGDGNNTTPTSEPTLTSSKQSIDLADGLEIAGKGILADFAIANCEAIPTSGIGNVGAALARFNEKASSVTEPRKALAFISEQTGAGASLQKFDSEVETALNTLVKSVTNQIDSTKYSFDAFSWNEDLEAALIENCPDLSPLKSLAERVTEFEKQSKRLNALADSVPWYPEGFEAFSADVATKFVRGRGCDYGSCWNYDIVTKRPCSLLYVEMNIFDSSDSLVDWTNSTARNVVAGEIVKVQMNTFEDAAESGRITEITCS
jgi:hypothetical protein